MAAKRGRAAGFEMSNEHRLKIRNSNILNALIEHVEGNRDMSATQVSAGLRLLKKVMPDLTESKNININVDAAIDEMSDYELSAAIAQLRSQLAAKAGAEPAEEVSPPITH